MRASILSLAILAAFGLHAADNGSFNPPEHEQWYRLTTRYTGNDIRRGRCIELMPDANPAFSLMAEDKVDTSDPAYDSQFWTFEEDLDNPGHYALICRAYPDGYLSTKPQIDGKIVTADRLGRDCRWIYVTEPTDTPDDKYGFIFMTNDGLSGVDPETGYSYAGISTDFLYNLVGGDLDRTIYMNCGAQRVGYAINLWSQAYDEAANEWLFALEPEHIQQTDITTVTTEPEDTSTVVYDLSGRVMDSPKGICIVGRRLTFVP